LQNTSLRLYADNYSTHYDHHVILISAGVTISMRYFTKNRVLYWCINSSIPTPQRKFPNPDRLLYPCYIGQHRDTWEHSG